MLCRIALSKNRPQKAVFSFLILALNLTLSPLCGCALDTTTNTPSQQIPETIINSEITTALTFLESLLKLHNVNIPQPLAILIDRIKTNGTFEHELVEQGIIAAINVIDAHCDLLTSDNITMLLNALSSYADIGSYMTKKLHKKNFRHPKRSSKNN